MMFTSWQRGYNDNNTLDWIVYGEDGHQMYHFEVNTSIQLSDLLGNMRLYRYDEYNHRNGSIDWDWNLTTERDLPCRRVYVYYCNVSRARGR